MTSPHTMADRAMLLMMQSRTMASNIIEQNSFVASLASDAFECAYAQHIQGAVLMAKLMADIDRVKISGEPVRRVKDRSQKYSKLLQALHAHLSTVFLLRLNEAGQKYLDALGHHVIANMVYEQEISHDEMPNLFQHAIEISGKKLFRRTM